MTDLIPHARKGRWPALVLCFPLVFACRMQDPEDFNQQAAELVCRYNEECIHEPGDPVDDVLNDDAFQYGDGPACEPDFLEAHEDCPIQCEYDRRQAVKCLRNLEKMIKNCDITENKMNPCQDVFNCHDSQDQGLIDRCGFEVTSETCLCTTDASRTGDFGLLAFFGAGLLGLRRRRRRGRGRA